MIPYITKGDLTKLPEKRQKKICGCTPKCKEFMTFQAEEEDFILCATDAKEFSFDILEQLGLVTQKKAFPKTKWGWTTEQERFLIKYLKDPNAYTEKGQVKNGTYTLLAEMLDKTRETVKNKVYHMKETGRI